MTRQFHTTRWSVVVAAGKPDSPEAGRALEILCTTYWYPLYAFARGRGSSRHEAEDLAQCFFAYLLEKNFVNSADRSRGRFRAFLLTAFKRFCTRERDRFRAQKRGGGRQPLSIDFDDGERRFSLEPAHEETPERLFDRQWALTLLDRVIERLRDEMDASGKAGLFDTLKPCLIAASGPPPAGIWPISSA